MTDQEMEWTCSSCGAVWRDGADDFGDWRGVWDVSGTGEDGVARPITLEHKCPGNHSQCGYFAAEQKLLGGQCE